MLRAVRHSVVAKGADLASGLGAIVLGAGLALVLPAWLRSHATALLVAGAVVHALGMTLKHRLEARDGAASSSERTLFWLCWIGLLALAVWLIAAAFATPK